jgi:hypothetical protein
VCGSRGDSAHFENSVLFEIAGDLGEEAALCALLSLDRWAPMISPLFIKLFVSNFHLGVMRSAV